MIPRNKVPNMKRVASIIALLALLMGCFPTTVTAAGEVTLPVCSANVHAEYSVVGPDGQTYPSWHPQIDHYSNCHYDHEHGSNPALVGPVSWPYGTSIVPAYGYTAAKHGMEEGHAGFKTYVFRLSGHTWMITHHFGTANPQNAACARFHTVDMVIVDGAGVVQADIHFMGDFGAATAIDTGVDLTPTACPNQAADARAAGSNGERQIPVGANATNYEPWRLDTRELTAIGFRSGALTINTSDPQKACNAVTCDSGVVKTQLPGENNRGAARFVTFNGPAQGNLRISGAVSGTFYTDPMGMQTLSANDPHAVKQYIKPGFSITVGPQEHCITSYSTGSDGLYHCALPLPDQLSPKLNRLVTGPN